MIDRREGTSLCPSRINSQSPGGQTGLLPSSYRLIKGPPEPAVRDLCLTSCVRAGAHLPPLSLRYRTTVLVGITQRARDHGLYSNHPPSSLL